MEANKLNRKIEIQQYTEVENELFQKIREWKTVKEPWALVRYLGSEVKKFEDIGKEELHVDYVIVIRYRPGITTDMRVKYLDKILNIDSIINIGEQNKELCLLCKFQGEEDFRA